MASSSAAQLSMRASLCPASARCHQARSSSGRTAAAPRQTALVVAHGAPPAHEHDDDLGPVATKGAASGGHFPHVLSPKAFAIKQPFCWYPFPPLSLNPSGPPGGASEQGVGQDRERLPQWPEV